MDKQISSMSTTAESSLRQCCSLVTHLVLEYPHLEPNADQALKSSGRLEWTRTLFAEAQSTSQSTEPVSRLCLGTLVWLTR